jgi:hypothetical protein
MANIVVQFSGPEGISKPDSEAIKFPFALVSSEYVGTPRQTSETKSGRISVEITGSLMAVWRLEKSKLSKVLFQFAKEHLEKMLKQGKFEPDTKVTLNTGTHKGSCPFDPRFVEEPDGATLEIEVKRPIGFI